MGVSYIDTDAKADVYRTAKIEATGLKVRDTSNGTLVLSVGKDVLRAGCKLLPDFYAVIPKLYPILTRGLPTLIS